MAAAAAEPTAPPAAKTGMMGKPVVLGGLLIGVMAAEFAVLYVMLPGPAVDPAAAAEAVAMEESAETVEVAVDTFSTTNGRAAPGSVIHVTFKLTARVPAGQDVAFGQAANLDQKARVRQAVFEVARSASLDDLNDPALTTIKRQLREDINKILRKSYVTEAVITDYKTMEQ